MELISYSRRPTTVDRREVGGKAHSLFKMIENGAVVPDFFVLTTAAFRANPSGKISDKLKAEIASALAELGVEKPVAVRSSATAEDSEGDSFAGIFDTFLNLQDIEEICDAIEKCWQSFSGVRAASYRRERGVENDDGMAVIVQHMVPAEWAGVVFTADPVNQLLSNIVVNAVPGIGEALVSGEVNPEQIRLAASGEVIGRQVPENAVPLPDSILANLVAASIKLAEKMGFPQDIEWAYAHETLYFLQTRPITTIAGVVHNRYLEAAPDHYLDDPSVRWTRAFADEVWSPPVSPLFYDIQNLSAHLLMRLQLEGEGKNLPVNVFKYFRAAPYADTSILARIYANLPPLARRPGLLAQLPRDEQERVRAAPFKIKPALYRIWNFEVRRRQRWSLFKNHQFLERSWENFINNAHRLVEIDISALSEQEWARHVDEIWQLALCVGVECEVAVLYHAYDLKLILTGLLDRWFQNGDELFAAVVSGLPDSQTVRESDELWHIAEKIRAYGDAVVSQFQNTSYAELKELDTDPAKEILADIEKFLKTHVHRGANYKDLIYPRWGDDPELLWNQIKTFVAHRGKSPRDINEATSKRRVATQERLIKSLLGWRTIYRKPLLKFLLKYNEIYSGLRDNHRFYYDHVWFLLRRAYLEKGRRLARRSLLSQPEDIFFLCRNEISDLQEGRVSTTIISDRVVTRRKEWEQTVKTLPPKFIYHGYLPLAETRSNGASTELQGIAASSGQVTGRARVVYDISGLAALHADEILVTRQTDPAWTPAFSRLAGLVLETGGTLAHGASLCREFGLPCVTAVDGATERINDGDLIFIRGGDGIVEILERAHPVHAAEQ